MLGNNCRHHFTLQHQHSPQQQYRGNDTWNVIGAVSLRIGPWRRRAPRRKQYLCICWRTGSAASAARLDWFECFSPPVQYHCCTAEGLQFERLSILQLLAAQRLWQVLTIASRGPPSSSSSSTIAARPPEDVSGGAAAAFFASSAVVKSGLMHACPGAMKSSRSPRNTEAIARPGVVSSRQERRGKRARSRLDGKMRRN